MVLRIMMPDLEGPGEKTGRGRPDDASRLGIVNDRLAFPFRVLILLANGNHRVALASWRRSAIKNAYRHMHDGKSVRISFHELTPKREKTANMIPVRMRQDDLVHASQVDIQFLRIFQHCLRSGACVDEHTVVIGVDKSSESPLADSAWFAH